MIESRNDVIEQLKKLLTNKMVTDQQLVSLLSRVGYIKPGCDCSVFINLQASANPKIRTLALKNLAKTANYNYMSHYMQVLRSEDSSEVRKEAVSAIGRLRDPRTIDVMKYLLDDKDPEVVLQALRGLICFKKRDDIFSILLSMQSHSNEIIRSFIDKELNSSKDTGSKSDEVSSPDKLKNLVIEGDVARILDFIPDESIHLTFTSPPYYNARDYSIYQSYQEYLGFLEGIFKKIHRVTKEGRFFALNTSPIIIPRVSRQHSSIRYPIPFDIHPLLVDMGWEFIDDIVWVKPEASVKNRVAGFDMHRKPLAYKPNPRTEYVMVYRKKTHKLIDWNIRNYPYSTVAKSKVEGEYDTSNVWEIDPVYDRVHSAVFPFLLCEKVLRYYSYMGDLVFDPFGGSGTFAKAALSLNRYFITTEIHSDYVRRIKANLTQKDILQDTKDISFLNTESFQERMGEK